MSFTMKRHFLSEHLWLVLNHGMIITVMIEQSINSPGAHAGLYRVLDDNAHVIQTMCKINVSSIFRVAYKRTFKMLFYDILDIFVLVAIYNKNLNENLVF